MKSIAALILTIGLGAGALHNSKRCERPTLTSA